MAEPRRYGYIRDFKSITDPLFKSIRKPDIAIPEKVDLWQSQSKVLDQGQLGSCVAQALVSALGFLLLRNATKKHIMRKVEGQDYYNLSPLFLYHEARKIDGTLKMDAGTQIRSAILALSKVGVCREDLWPYVIEDYQKTPPEEVYEDAKCRLITDYYRIESVEEMMECLAEGYPFTFGVSVYESFETPETERTGIIPMPRLNERLVGGHCMLGTSYDQETKMFGFKNSYDGWGLNSAGYGKIPFAYMRDLASDCHVVRV